MRVGPVISRSSCRRWLGLLVLVAVSLAPGCGDTPEAAAPPPEPVQVAPVIQKDVPIYGEWVGTTVGYVSAQIRARVSGYVVSQDYKEGTPVQIYGNASKLVGYATQPDGSLKEITNATIPYNSPQGLAGF